MLEHVAEEHGVEAAAGSPRATDLERAADDLVVDPRRGGRVLRVGLDARDPTRLRARAARRPSRRASSRRRARPRRPPARAPRGPRAAKRPSRRSGGGRRPDPPRPRRPRRRSGGTLSRARRADSPPRAPRGGRRTPGDAGAPTGTAAAPRPTRRSRRPPRPAASASSRRTAGASPRLLAPRLVRDGKEQVEVRPRRQPRDEPDAAGRARGTPPDRRGRAPTAPSPAASATMGARPGVSVRGRAGKLPDDARASGARPTAPRPKPRDAAATRSKSRPAVRPSRRASPWPLRRRCRWPRRPASCLPCAGRGRASSGCARRRRRSGGRARRRRRGR